MLDRRIFLKNFNGEVLDHEIDSINMYSANGTDIIEIQLKDTFNILTASISEIMDRINESTDGFIGCEYEGGILFLKKCKNIDKLKHDLNIPYYTSPINNNLINSHYMIRDEGLYLNLRSLRVAISRAKEKGELK